ncbi:IS4 family transposase [Lewinella sp. LCG006]|uniref:IS4 family transposase n=1 Tax=Lewinella sp. LCG006 TaxID=3231911 RepID=UPI00346157A6
MEEELRNEEFARCHKVNAKAFSRNRVLTMATTILILVNNVSKSLGVEISKFLQRFGKSVVSKQAFSKARYKLKVSAFKHLNKLLVSNFYSIGNYHLYKEKYLLLSSDGTDFHLPWTEEIVAEFSMMDNGMSDQPKCLARCIKVWDVLNRLSVQTQLYEYEAAEINMFAQNWEEIKKWLLPKIEAPVILLADMAYPAFWLFNKLNNSGVSFLFRCKKDYCTEVKAFIASDEDHANLRLDMTKYGRKKKLKWMGFIQEFSDFPDFIDVRIYRAKAESGKEAYLITSLSEEEVSNDELSDLYNQRWGVETSIDFDKNKTEIENFAAKYPEGIRQEWQAATLASNIAQLLINDAQEELDKEQLGKNNKYHYQINKSVALGLIKNELPKFMMGQEDYEQFYKRMIGLIRRYKEPVRPGRSYARKRKHKHKYPMNMRRVS